MKKELLKYVYEVEKKTIQKKQKLGSQFSLNV